MKSGLFMGIMAVAALALVSTAGAAPRAVATVIRDVRIVTVSGPVIERGVLLLRDGRIAAVGERVAVPPEARVVDGRGLTAYPGMIEGNSRLGLSEIGSVRATEDARELGDLNPHLLAASAINPHSELIPVTRANGITTVLSRPVGGTVSGQCALLNLTGWTPGEMMIRPRGALQIQYPTGSGEEQNKKLDALRKLLKDAQAYMPPDPQSGTPGDLRLAALQPYVKGELLVILDADSEGEIRGAVALAEEFRLKFILSGVAEGYRVAELLKGKGVSCFVGPVTAQPEKTGVAYDALYTNPAALHRAGVRFAIISGETANARNLPYQAAMAMAYGLAPAEALRAITLRPAELLGIDRDYGSLEVGKVANLFLATGDPLDARTVVKAVYIQGEPVDMSNRHDALYQKFLRRLDTPRAEHAAGEANEAVPAAPVPAPVPATAE
ncbi:MAG TPA: amidohydrolase family protein [Armatimonadota bacterium]|nr:amidohydrolase family protein [Armatimonadota bacterium]